jgi:hypothetical protein
MTLNKQTTIYFLDDDTIIERQVSCYVDTISPLINQPFYYIEFKLSLAMLPDIIPEEILTDLVNGSTRLILVNSHEAFHSVVEEIYNVAVEKLNISPSNITLYSESADILVEIQRISSLRNLPEIKAVWIHLFEKMIKQNLHNKRFQSNIILPVKDYSKSFLNFNRRWRLHRPILVALFCALGILDKGYISLGKTSEGIEWENVWKMILHQNRESPDILTILLSKQEEICNLPPLYLDTDDLYQNPVDLEPNTQYLYSETYFSVVSETNFYKLHQPGRFLSEKIFKPIAMYHPFVIVSVPGTLQLLKELGYKTFSPLIDESYDNEEDDNKRLLMIAEETRRLSNLNKEEMANFLRYVRPICVHNKHILLRKEIYHKELN